jgi:hypothetical protein
VVLTPASIALLTRATQQFAASGRMSDGSTRAVMVTWSASGGTISSAGLYTAGLVAGIYPVIATQTGGTLADTAIITVTAPTPPPPPACVGVTINVGDDWQAKVDANPAGTTYCIAPGTHVQPRVLPETGDQFICDGVIRSCVMDGQDIKNVAFWPGWGPTYPSGVVIRGLKVTRYAPAFQQAAIETFSSASNWLLEDLEVSYNTRRGINLGPRNTLRRAYVHHNTTMGMGAEGVAVLVEDIELSYNNWVTRSSWIGDEGGGGVKFWDTDSLIVRNSYSHHNWGPGFWNDYNNRNVLYEGNRAEDNSGPGFYHEISRSAIYRYNTSKRNGLWPQDWIWAGGIQIANSEDVEVYGNRFEDNKGSSISVTQQDRPGCGWLPCLTKNVSVHDNTVIVRGRGYAAAAGHDCATCSNAATFYDPSNGIFFQNNNYYVTSQIIGWSWQQSASRTWAEWQAYGQDVAGTRNIIP